MNKNIVRIALTGGPCAGKTTALVKIIERFTDRGYLVYALPESPTLFNAASVNFLTEDKTYFYNIEKALLKFQLHLENTFYDLAKSVKKPVIIISDRGTMDISAYMDPNMWQAILDELSLSEVMLRDARYDAVIHMVTAAKGAEEFYTTENNSARSESVELARELDEKILKAWTGHQNLRIVGNKKDFNAKIEQAIHEIATILGDDTSVETRRTFKVDVIGDIPYGIETEITEYTLNTDVPGGMKIRKRGTSGNFVYFLSRYSTSIDGRSVEVERLITPDEFLTYLRQVDESVPVVFKKRKSFVWGGLSLEVDTLIEPYYDYSLLHIMTAKPTSELKFPPFIKLLEELDRNSPDGIKRNVKQ